MAVGENHDIEGNYEPSPNNILSGCQWLFFYEWNIISVSTVLIEFESVIGMGAKFSF